MVFHAAHLFPGLRFGLDEERFHAPGGLGDFVALFGSDFGRHFSTSVDAGACFVYATAAGYGRVTQWQSWANGMPTLEHGTHVDGFQNALRRIDWKPAFAAVHVVMRHPRFSAPTRDKLCVEEVRDAVQKALIPPLLAAQEAQKN
jgi:DNA gyrase/topoisomerase IV subunit B